MEKLGQNNIYSQYLGNKAILRTYKGTDLINEYVHLYTPPVDWSDIRIDCPENSIALYAAHSADYSSYDNLGFTATMSATDLTTVGSPTIVDGVASEFSSSNYLKTSLSLSSDNEKIRIKIRFKTPETFVSGNTNILTFGNSLTTNNCIRIYTGSSYSRISSFGNDINTGSPNLQTNTFYVVDVLIDGNKQYSYLYDDNNTKLAESANTTKTANFNNIGFFGGRFYSPIQEIDFNNTSIEVNDVYYLLPYGSSNGYNVFIDGTQYGSTYASGAQCSITWSTSGITTGDDITTPTALKAHKIWVEPATSGNNITAFQCRRVAASGQEEQGVLWTHFNIGNTIAAERMFGLYNTYFNKILTAITARNNILNVSTSSKICTYTEGLEYLPLLVGDNIARNINNMFYQGAYKLDKVKLKNFKFGASCQQAFYNSHIKEFTMKNCDTSGAKNLKAFFYNDWSLEKFSDFDFSSAEEMVSFMYNCHNLKDMTLDVSSAKNLKAISCWATAQGFISGLKGLRVSNEAPFDYATPPQIKVDYTGMNRNALVQLFNDLPYNVGYEVVGSPTINNGVVSGFSSNDNLKTSSIFTQAIYDDFIQNSETVVKFKLNSLQRQHILHIPTGGTYAGFYMSGIGGKIVWQIYSTAYRISPDFVFSTNTDYWLKGTINNGTATLSYSIDGTNYTILDTLSVSDIPAPTSFVEPIALGYYSSELGPVNGSIDLNNTYIKINDVYWFRGQPAMTKALSCIGCTGNQLSIVGSPTIVDGVVSGFSNVPNRSDVTTLESLPASSSLLIQVKFNTGTLKTSANQFILSTLSQTNRNICWGVAGPSKKIRIYLSSNGTTWDIANSVNGTHILADNTDYIVRLTFDGSKYVVSLLIDGQWVDDITITSSLTLSKQILRFGNNESGSSYWPGSIDLNETYIKVNGETWFDINNCLLPEDKAIATNKGWSLTTT